MKSTQAIRAGVLLMAAVSTVSGCASRNASDGPQPGSSGVSSSTEPSVAYPAPKVVGPLTTPTSYKNAGIELVPDLSATSLNVVSASSAYGFCGHGEGACSTAGSPTISLARASLPDAGKANSDGSIAPMIANKLVYVITWQGVPCKPAGGPIKPTSNSTSPSKSYICTMINLVDATSGAFLYGVQSTNP